MLGRVEGSLGEKTNTADNNIQYGMLGNTMYSGHHIVKQSP
jgi:hypothetical protein